MLPASPPLILRDCGGDLHFTRYRRATPAGHMPNGYGTFTRLSDLADPTRMEVPMFRHMFALLPFVAFSAFELGDPPAGDPPQDPPAGDPPKPKGKPEGITDEVQEWVNGLIAKEARAAEKRGRDAEKTAAEKAKADAEAELKRKADEEKGDYEKVRNELIAERDQFKTENELILAERDALKADFDARFAAALKNLPEPILAFQPDADASFATKSAWLTKAEEQAAKIAPGTPRGNGLQIPPSGPPKEEIKTGLTKRQYLG
jgi:predicted  nucleic acid-binding Zn-ribbon protein